MSALSNIFAAMRQSGMTEWVGGGDPEHVGKLGLSSITHNLAIDPSDRVLDFGCGIGRVSALLAPMLSDGCLVGVDIIPAQIKFCKEQIASRFANTITVLALKIRNTITLSLSMQMMNLFKKTPY
jgi:SAM-dependent methyltransferase